MSKEVEELRKLIVPGKNRIKIAEDIEAYIKTREKSAQALGFKHGWDERGDNIKTNYIKKEDVLEAVGDLEEDNFGDHHRIIGANEVRKDIKSKLNLGDK